MNPPNTVFKRWRRVRDFNIGVNLFKYIVHRKLHYTIKKKTTHTHIK
jgi:hypothetical protein